jgi:hypothetical protein
MPIIKGTPKKQMAKRTITVPETLAARIQQFIKYSDAAGRGSVTESEIFVQAAEYALKSDKGFSEWEQGVGGKAAPRHVVRRDRGERAPGRMSPDGQPEGAPERVAAS